MTLRDGYAKGYLALQTARKLAARVESAAERWVKKPKQCPGCGSQRIKQSRRRGLIEPALTKIYVRPFRCQRCSHRFIRWSPVEEPNASVPENIY